MKTRTRIYAVLNYETGDQQLVRAQSVRSAVDAICRPLYAGRIATQDDIVALIAGGVVDAAARHLERIDAAINKQAAEK